MNTFIVIVFVTNITIVGRFSKNDSTRKENGAGSGNQHLVIGGSTSGARPDVQDKRRRFNFHVMITTRRCTFVFVLTAKLCPLLLVLGDIVTYSVVAIALESVSQGAVSSPGRFLCVLFLGNTLSFQSPTPRHSTETNRDTFGGRQTFITTIVLK